MTELLVQFRTKIDWLNSDDWTYGSNWTFDTDSQGQYTADVNGSGNLLKKGLVELGKSYNISFEISSYTSGELKFNIGQHLSDNYTSVGTYSFTSGPMWNDDFILKGYSTSDLSIKNLVIEEVGYQSLDLFEDPQIAVNYQFKDIKNPEQIKGSYTKSIKIPGTDKNNKFFSYIFDINQDNRYSMAAKCNASIKVGDLVLMDGFIKLDNIIVVDSFKNYDVTFYEEAVNLWNDIMEDTLAVLDFSSLNHTLNYATIKRSWINFSAGTRDIVYPYIDYGNGRQNLYSKHIGRKATDITGEGLAPDDFYAAIRASWIYNKIYDHYGYTLNSNLVNSYPFNQQIIPFSQSEETLYKWNIIARVTVNQSYALTFQDEIYRTLNTDGTYKLNYVYFPKSDGVLNSTTDNTSIYTPSKLVRDTTYSQSNFFNVSDDNYDIHYYSNNMYALPGMFHINSDGKYKMKIKCKMVAAPNTTYPETVKCYISKLKGLSNISFAANTYQWKCLNETDEVTEIYSKTFTSSNTTTDWMILSGETTCATNDMISIKFGQIGHAKILLEYIEIEKYGYVDVSTIDMDVMKDKNMKIKDFLTSFNKMYNLVSVYDGENINVEPYSTYMKTSGTTRNWNSRLNKDKEIKIELPKDYLNQFINFKFKDADDLWNDRFNKYKDQVGLGRGGKKIKIENEFIKSEKTIEPIFKPTALRGNYDMSEVPFSFPRYQMYSDPQTTYDYTLNTKIGPRILYFQWIPSWGNGRNFRVRGVNQTAGSSKMYPYAGDVLFPNDQDSANAYSLTYDFEMQANGDGVWQPQTRYRRHTSWLDWHHSYTNNNLYNLYWKEYIEQISDKNARLVTAYFNLDVEELHDFQFADKIFVENVWYRVYRIIDFNPDGKSPTKVELIKLNDVNISYDQYVTANKDEEIIVNSSDVINSFDLGTDNNITGENNLVVGSNNLLTGTDPTIIFGDNNSGGILTVGDDNTSNENSVILNSDGIYINDTGITATVIGYPSGTTITQDGVYIGGVQIDNGDIFDMMEIEIGGDINSDGVFNPWRFRDYHIVQEGENGNNILDENIWEIEGGDINQ